jgi:mannose-6-phosphate isomerase-like protein (cupin superfamily)
MNDSIVVGEDEVTFRLTSDQSDGAMIALEVRIPAGGGPPMLHRHEPFELYRVERGELAFYVEGDRQTVNRTVAEAGSVVAIPGGREHTVRNESSEESAAFVIFSPGDEMERFVRAAGDLGEPGIEDVLALAAAHGVELTRPLEEVA